MSDLTSSQRIAANLDKPSTSNYRATPVISIIFANPAQTRSKYIALRGQNPIIVSKPPMIF
jgi:hypothetical protein